MTRPMAVTGPAALLLAAALFLVGHRRTTERALAITDHLAGFARSATPTLHPRGPCTMKPFKRARRALFTRSPTVQALRRSLQR
jgi:hypothetical protein